MVNVFFALGSNVGNSQQYIQQAVTAIQKQVTITAKAPVYTSKAVGVTDQPDFYNTVIKGDTGLSPLDLLLFVKQIENDLGRVERFRWGPREIDIDIIFYDDLVMTSPQLTIPHPRFAEREFVLRPMFDIAPDFIDPISRLAVKELLQQLNDTDKSILKKL